MEFGSTRVGLKEWGAVFVVALSVQFLFAAAGQFFRDPTACLLGDSWILHSMAVNFNAHGLMNYQEASPTLTQLPGYPWLIAMSYRLVGEDPRWLLAFQMILGSALTAWLPQRVQNFLGPWRWMLAGWMILDLHRLLYSGCLLTEFWVWSCWLLAWSALVSYFEKEGVGSLGWAILLLGVAAWFKPLAGYFPPLMFLGWLVMHPRWFWTRRRSLALALGLYMLILAPLLWRNYQLTGEFPRYTTIGSFNSIYFNAVYFESLQRGIPVDQARHEWVQRMAREVERERGVDIDEIDVKTAGDRRYHREALGLSEVEYARLSDRMFSRFMRENGAAYVGLHFREGLSIFTVSNLSWIKYFFERFENVSFSKLSLAEICSQLLDPAGQGLFLVIRIWELGFVGILCLLALSALIFRWREMWSLPWLTAIFFVVHIFGACGINTWGRFRFLFMPFLILLGTYGARIWLEKLKKWRYSTTRSP